MQWQRVVVTTALLCFAAAPSRAESWLSAFVGDRGLSGNASQSGDEWTIEGGGADVWDRSDAFQFLHHPVADNSSITARIDDLQNTDTFAKAGVMVRASLDVGAAMAILDVRPAGAIEFMTRSTAGDVVTFLASQTAVFPVWLRLSWSQGSVIAWTSQDGNNWTFLANAAVNLPSSFEAGVAVTSHDPTTLTTAHVGALATALRDVPPWNSTDVGDVGVVGSASEANGVWTISGAGADVWGTADGLHYVYRQAIAQYLPWSLRVRLTDMQNTSSFAKAGLMIRMSLDAGGAAVLLDVRPTGDVEFMMRPSAGAEMQYVGGLTVTLPSWLELDWTPTDNTDFSKPIRVTARVSQDGINYTPVPPNGGVTINFPRVANAFPIPPGTMYQVGAFVSSHDANALNVAHFDGLSLFRQGTTPVEVGNTGQIGNGVADWTVLGTPYIVEGAGADIWGTKDSFEFFLLPPEPSTGAGLQEVVTIHAANPFAKAGLMYRDGEPPNAQAAMAILDVKPDGGVEFMARTCFGCPVTYVNGANIGVPALLRLTHSGTTTFSAQVSTPDKSHTVDLGSVTVPMNTLSPGFAVTSHDPSQIAVGVFKSQ